MCVGEEAGGGVWSGPSEEEEEEEGARGQTKGRRREREGVWIKAAEETADDG